jgi:hypothetical protein
MVPVLVAAHAAGRADKTRANSWRTRATKPRYKCHSNGRRVISYARRILIMISYAYGNVSHIMNDTWDMSPLEPVASRNGTHSPASLFCCERNSHQDILRPLFHWP